MDRRRLLSALGLMLAAPLAARAQDKPDKDKSEKDKKAPEQSVDLQPVGLPIVVDGQLVNYVFVTMRLFLTPRANTELWRGKEPYFRDALVRASYQTPFVVTGDYEKIDAAKLCATLLREAQAITGPGVVKSVAVLSQTPSHRARKPPA